MNKSSKPRRTSLKLTIAKSTVRALATDDLKHAVGGTHNLHSLVQPILCTVTQ
jgi:hypothetical protein